MNERLRRIAYAAFLFLSYFLLSAMAVETASVCFGISALLRRNGLAAGLGIAAVFYFLNIIANLTEDAKILKYITPFGYTDGADIISDKSLNGGYIAAGAVFTLAGILLAYIRYGKKDIAS